MSLTPVWLWTLQSPDGTIWTPTISVEGLVTWTSGGAPLTFLPPVYQGVPASVVWAPSISNDGIETITRGVAAAQLWATLLDPAGRLWMFTVTVEGVVSVTIDPSVSITGGRMNYTGPPPFITGSKLALELYGTTYRTWSH